MIGPYDASLLALTKLRTRPIRTAVTIVISGLLFAGLIAALTIAKGAEDSIQSFSKEGLNSKYIVATSPDTPAAAHGINDPGVLAEAQQIYNQTIAEKKVAAKKLDISYDPSTELVPTLSLPAQFGLPAQTHLDFASPAALQALQHYANAHPAPGMPEFKASAYAYNPTDFFKVTTGGTSNGSLSTMQNGLESFTSSDPAEIISQDSDPLHSSQIEKADDQLTTPFLLPGQSRHYSQTEVPIIVPYSKAAQLLGMPSLAKGATPVQKLSRIKTLYAKADTITFAACYRNSVSEQQIQTAITQAADIAKNKTNKHYQKPTLIYGLPAADSCGQAAILSDTRSTSERATDRKQDEFNRMFGTEVDPVQQKLIFRVVGLSPDTSSGSSTTFGGMLQNIVGSSLDGAIVIPNSMLTASQNANLVNQILFTNASNPLAFSSTLYYAEFANADDARNFINSKSCTTRSDGTCATTVRPFQLNAYGSNSIAIADLRHKFAHFFEMGALGVIIIAIIIMSGTVGRMIADGRRETAVFRAIGAKRLDIATVYSLYTLGLSTLVALFALIAGLVAAHLFDDYFWRSTTAQAQLLFGASDITRQFRFFAIEPRSLGLVLIAASVTGLVSAVLPLVRNVRRSPIKDMREE